MGRDFAIADFNVLRLWGWPAWWLWLGAHIFFLIGFANRLLVMTQWAVSFLSNRRLVRIFPSEEQEVAARALEDEPESPPREVPPAASPVQSPAPQSDPAARPGTV